MRKQYKKKKRSCALCKPHKMGWNNRWTVKERERQELDEKEIRMVKYGIPEED